MSDTKEALKIALEALNRISEFETWEPAGPAATTAFDAIDKIAALSPPSAVNVQSKYTMLDAQLAIILGDCNANEISASDAAKQIKELFAALPPAVQVPEEKTFAFGQTAFERMRMTLELIAMRDTDLTPENLAYSVLKEIGHWKADAEPVAAPSTSPQGG